MPCLVSHGSEKQSRTWQSIRGRRCTLSSAPSKETTHHRTEAGDFPGDAPAQKKLVRVVIQSETGRNPECPSRRQVPGNDRRHVMRGLMKAEVVAVAEAAVHFGARGKVLRAKRAAVWGSLQGERTAGA